MLPHYCLFIVNSELLNRNEIVVLRSALNGATIISGVKMGKMFHEEGNTIAIYV